ncbi:MAG: HAD-IC family P-type ATPase [Rhodospirillales bacterium]|nr:HAD-IC family P-type ATPase [Rhodospirillales bacterium]
MEHSSGPSPAPEAGLSSAAAADLLARLGANAMPAEKPHPLRDAVEKFWAPVPWMLEAAILLQLALGERVEAGILGALLVFNAALGFFQESRAQAALAALRERLALTASVRRDGAWTTLPAAALVPGDVVKLSLGAVVPADLVLSSGSVLLDQSLLTGESMPVERGAGEAAYASTLVQRGEAIGTVSATGERTRFGHTAELVRVAHSVSGEQRAVLAVVRNLAVLNGAVVVALVGYALAIHLAPVQIVRLVLTAVLASIPVALPATFTLASALAAQRLTRLGVLPTRLSAVHEAATMDVLCSDKTGTLTRNALRVEAVRPMPGFEAGRVLALGALASSEGGADPVDQAVRAAAAADAEAADGVAALRLVRFTPFDPATKRAEALARDAQDHPLRIVKGAFAAVIGLADIPPEAAALVDALGAQGHRVLAVAAGAPDALHLAGLIALSDPPRADSPSLIARLAALGVRVVMVTGDAPVTAASVAAAVGLSGPVCPAGRIADAVRPEEYAVFAGVLPEDKFHLVQAFQRGGRTVGMCGDGANDAPALRQAQIGIAVASATDIAKSAAGIVLTEPGLGGIVAAVQEGRATFQRILTYGLNTLIKKVELVLFLAVGLVITGRAVLTPILMVLLLVTNDFLTMALTTDRARISPRPERWRITRLTAAAAVLGLGKLAFSTLVLVAGRSLLGLDGAALRSLAFLALVFGGQASVYVVRERRALWSSRPSAMLLASSAADLAIAGGLAFAGVLMAPLAPSLIGATLLAAALFALALDRVKIRLFARLDLA